MDRSRELPTRACCLDQPWQVVHLLHRLHTNGQSDSEEILHLCATKKEMMALPPAQTSCPAGLLWILACKC